MALLIHNSTMILWYDLVKSAEGECLITLNDELEMYLISLLIRYMDKPELAQQIFAKSFLSALLTKTVERRTRLQVVGDQCLLYAGLYPSHAEKRRVTVSYFVDLGRSAYASISDSSNDMYGTLATQFVTLMDILQAIKHAQEIPPMQAYEQWVELDSQRSYQMLINTTKGLPVKK